MAAEKLSVNRLTSARNKFICIGMIQKAELDALEQRAHEARVTMAQVCKRAGIFRQSWSRARRRGSANYTLIDPLEKALAAIERERMEASR